MRPPVLILAGVKTDTLARAKEVFTAAVAELKAASIGSELRAGTIGSELRAGGTGLQVGAEEAAGGAPADGLGPLQTYVIGHGTDPLRFEGQPGFNVLNLKTGWTQDVNDAWVQSGIDKGAAFRLASPIDDATLTSVTRGLTVYGKELRQLWNAGYRLAGNHMVLEAW